MSNPAVLTCPECEGEGLEYPTPSFTESHPLPVPCPSCSGSGVVPSPEAVEAAIIAGIRVIQADSESRFGSGVYPTEGELRAVHLSMGAALGEFLRLNQEGK